MIGDRSGTVKSCRSPALYDPIGGVALGIAASAAVGGLIQGAIPGTGGDVFTYLLIVPVVVVVVMLAAYIPTRRAAHIDPLLALRQD